MKFSASSQNALAASESLKSGMQAVTWTNIVMNVMLAGSMQTLWRMINALQMSLHLVGFNVILPANCQSIMATLISTTTI